ncbi:DNA topoisomerase, partial [Pseudomonas aeruginosa]|uniref:DNA topoisomerase n=2 Tax=Bacteria TaxID=2 RepID=UPI0037482FFE
VTKKAIKDGFNHLKDGRQYQHLYEAALARSEADWVVGINATRALTTKYDAQLSLGRVQTPTIQLVQSRQNEINQFKPQTYYTLTAIVDGFEFNYVSTQQRITDQQKLKNVMNQINKQQGN